MKAKRFTEEQIIAVLREAEAGAKPKDSCRRHGISEPTFYSWKAKVRRDDDSRCPPLEGSGYREAGLSVQRRERICNRGDRTKAAAKARPILKHSRATTRQAGSFRTRRSHCGGAVPRARISSLPDPRSARRDRRGASLAGCRLSGTQARGHPLPRSRDTAFCV